MPDTVYRKLCIRIIAARLPVLLLGARRTPSLLGLGGYVSRCGSGGRKSGAVKKRAGILGDERSSAHTNGDSSNLIPSVKSSGRVRSISVCPKHFEFGHTCLVAMQGNSDA
jgi:hypothetical protein